MRSEPLPSILVSQVQEVTGRFLEPVQLLSLVQPQLPLLPVLDGMRLVKTGPLLPLLGPPPNGVPLMPPRALSGKYHRPLIDYGITESKGIAFVNLHGYGICCPKVFGLDMRFMRERYPAALLSLEFQGESPVLSTLKWACITAAPPLRCIVRSIIE